MVFLQLHSIYHQLVNQICMVYAPYYLEAVLNKEYCFVGDHLVIQALDYDIMKP